MGKHDDGANRPGMSPGCGSACPWSVRIIFKLSRVSILMLKVDLEMVPRELSPVDFCQAL